MRAGIALGSNWGDREKNIREALRELLALHEGAEPFLRSKIHETEPVDCPPGSPAFLNAAVELTTSLSPTELLAKLKMIEASLGRPAERVFHAPRTIDLDLLYCDEIVLSLPNLALPHPEIPERLFVLQPLTEICPDRILPGQSLNVRDLAERIKTQPS